MENLIKHHGSKAAIMIIAALCAVLFMNTLGNSFMWDEKQLIEDNYHIKSFKNIPFLFSPDYWKFFHAGTKGQYRPARTLTFALDYAVSGMNPAGYHLTNLLLHLLNCLLVFSLAKSVLKSAAPADENLKIKTIAFYTAVFFACHPVHTEAVAWIKNRSDLLCFLFLLLSLLSFIRYIKTNHPRYYAGALLAFLLSLFSKEMGLSLPVIALFFILCFTEKEKRRKALLGLIPLFAVAVGFIVFKKSILGMVLYQDELPRISFYSHILSVIKTIGAYLWILIYPFKLNAERLFLIPISIMDKTVLLSAMIIALFISALIRSFKHSKPMLFGLLWTMAAVLPAANILFIWSRPIAEQRLYIPSLGFCLVLALLIDRLNGKKRLGKAGVILFIFLVSVYSLKTVQRNADWLNPLVFWTKTVKDSPQSARARNNLGNAYARADYLEKAASAFEKAIELDDQHGQAYNNLGNVHVEQAKQMMFAPNAGQIPRQQLDKALKLFEKAIEIDPADFQAYNNIGAIYDLLGEDKKAEACYESSLKINRYNYQAYLNLGLLLLKQGNMEKARDNFMRSIEVNPGYAHAYNNLGVAYENMGELDKAMEAFQKVIVLDPAYANAYYNIGYNYLRRNEYEKAIEYFAKTGEIDPTHIDAYMALGILYINAKDYDNAVRQYLAVLKLEPDNAKACNNLSYVYFQLKDHQSALKYNQKAVELGFPVDPGFDRQLKQYQGSD